MRLFLIVLLLCSVSVYWIHIRMRPEDRIHYEALIQENTEHRTQNEFQKRPAEQLRQGVQKDIWTHHGTRHFQIQSAESRLTLSAKSAKEELKHIQCIGEGGLILFAEEGSYSFPSQQLIAKNQCRLFQNGNQIEGTQIQFDLAKETLVCENPQGCLEGDIRFTANQLIWKKKENQLYLKGEVKLIASRIQDQESFAVADTLLYSSLEKTILLTAEKKVLFWQDGLSLSASEVYIRKDRTVEGRGDVHFTFDLEEQNYLETLFKPYL